MRPSRTPPREDAHTGPLLDDDYGRRIQRSIALLVDVYEEAAPAGINLLRYHGQLPPALQRITLSIVEDRGYRFPYNRFPYNVLRNIALEGCTADYVMAADVDFVPYAAVGRRPSAMLRRSLASLDVRDGSPNVLVLAAFEEVGLDNDEAVREVGRKFRETVLSLGGGTHPSEVFKAFRGRDPSPEALLRHSGLTE